MRIARYLIELGAVRSLSENCLIFDRAKCCKEFLRRIVRYLI